MFFVGEVSRQGINNNIIYMQQYKFRGQQVGTGEWVYGSLLVCEDSFGPICHIMVQHKFPFTREHFLVRMETVGQSIGVKGYTGSYENRHMNEVELFEGDIVEAMSEGAKGTFVIKWRQESAPCFILFPAWQSQKMWSIHASCLGRKDGSYYDDLKLIGNIHDNPELVNPASGQSGVNNMFDPNKAQAAPANQEAIAEQAAAGQEQANSAESAAQDAAVGAEERTEG
jgi:uncharacterized phage protein (TIGR01671 family)